MISGPRRLDVRQLSKVQLKTVVGYRKSVGPFAQWLLHNNYEPSNADEMDDLLAEFKNDSDMKRAAFENLLAAVEFVFPRFKMKLSWAHAISKGWTVQHRTKHAVPMGKGPCNLVAIHMSALGHARLGVGMILQNVRSNSVGLVVFRS
jgi:hypothetical protein